MSQLLPCPICARHVRRSESSCPFCGASVRFEPIAPVTRSPAERLGRAALFTFGAALATSASACTGSAVPAYGAPIDAAVQDAASADSGNDAAILAMYGGPPIDAGTDGGGGTLYGGPPQDAAAGIDTGGSSADYGAPPPPDSGA